MFLDLESLDFKSVTGNGITPTSVIDSSIVHWVTESLMQIVFGFQLNQLSIFQHNSILILVPHSTVDFSEQGS